MTMTATIPLSTRAEFNAALPPAPTTGAVADWERVRTALEHARRELQGKLTELDNNDSNDIDQLLAAHLNGTTPPDAPNHTTRTELAHHLGRINRALDKASHQLASARTRDAHWNDHQERCATWLNRWLDAQRQPRPVDGAPDMRGYYLAGLAAELEAASRKSNTP